MDRFGCNIDIQKADNRGEFIRGWAYVAADETGKVVDYGGDVLGGHSVDEGMAEVRKMAHEFIESVRAAKVVHKGRMIGEVVESVIIDDAMAETLGITNKRRGWWIGMRIDSEDVRKRIRSGELKQFSIGGRGKRLPILQEAA